MSECTKLLFWALWWLLSRLHQGGILFSLGCPPANFGHQHLCLSLLQHSVPVDVHALYYVVQSFNADKFALLETRLLCWVQSHSDHFELVCSLIV